MNVKSSLADTNNVYLINLASLGRITPSCYSEGNSHYGTFCDHHMRDLTGPSIIRHRRGIVQMLKWDIPL